jgi:hypothetical protein
MAPGDLDRRDIPAHAPSDRLCAATDAHRDPLLRRGPLGHSTGRQGPQRAGPRPGPGRACHCQVAPGSGPRGQAKNKYGRGRLEDQKAAGRLRNLKQLYQARRATSIRAATAAFFSSKGRRWRRRRNQPERVPGRAVDGEGAARTPRAAAASACSSASSEPAAASTSGSGGPAPPAAAPPPPPAPWRRGVTKGLQHGRHRGHPLPGKAPRAPVHCQPDSEQHNRQRRQLRRRGRRWPARVSASARAWRQANI